MNENRTSQADSALSGTALIMALHTLAAASAVTGVTLGLWGLLREPPAEADAGLSGLAGFWSLMGGLVVAGLLWALARMYRQRMLMLESLHRIESQLRHRAQLAAETPTASAPIFTEVPPPAPEPTVSTETLEKILAQLEELNQNVLLDVNQRQAKRDEFLRGLADQLARQIELAVQDGAMDEADQLLRRLRSESPGDARIESLQDRVEQGRQQVVRELIEGGIRQANDLMSVSRFDEAVRLAEDLRREYPKSDEAENLLERVRREAESFQSEQRRRLFEIIRERSDDRHWSGALEAAHRLLEKYPDSHEAQRVRSMMPTLVDNARLQEVRQLRDRFLEMIERRQYAEAVDLARHVVEHYPETAAAEELRDKMPRLEKLARGEFGGEGAYA